MVGLGISLQMLQIIRLFHQVEIRVGSTLYLRLEIVSGKGALWHPYFLIFTLVL